MISVADVPAVSGSLSVPKSGNWMAWLEMAGEIAAGPTLVTDDLGNAWACTVTTAGQVGGAFMARVVGGSGNMAQRVEPLHWTSTTARVVLASALGRLETQSPLISAGVLGAPLPFWSRVGQRLDSELERLAMTLSADWRVLPDGTVWIGTGRHEPQDPLAGQPYVLDANLAAGTMILAPDGLTVLVGDVVAGQEVAAVLYSLEGHFRATVWTNG